MPRRSGGRSSSPSPMRGGSSRPSNVPAHPPPSHPPAPVQAQPRQPGLFGQMAATAGGVAIGSAVGHAVGHAMTGGGSAAQPQAVDAAPGYQPQQQQQQYANPCAEHLEAFLQCAKSNPGDLNICYGFNEALKECKATYGMH